MHKFFTPPFQGRFFVVEYGDSALSQGAILKNFIPRLLFFLLISIVLFALFGLFRPKTENSFTPRPPQYYIAGAPVLGRPWLDEHDTAYYYDEYGNFDGVVFSYTTDEVIQFCDYSNPNLTEAGRLSVAEGQWTPHVSLGWLENLPEDMIIERVAGNDIEHGIEVRIRYYRDLDGDIRYRFISCKDVYWPRDPMFHTP